MKNIIIKISTVVVLVVTPMLLNAQAVITTVAGNGWGAGLGIGDNTGDGGPATSAKLFAPEYVSTDAQGNLFITSNDLIRKVDRTTGIISTIAGGGSTTGDGGLAINADLGLPNGLAFDANGDLYVTQTLRHRIRKITMATGIITTIAGDGTAGYAGDGGSAINSRVNNPQAICIKAGNLYFADADNNRVRKIDLATGIITNVAGNGTAGYGGDGGNAISSTLNHPIGVWVDNSNNIYISDMFNSIIRKVSAAIGIISTIAGTQGGFAYQGEGGLATDAYFNHPHGIYVDANGDILVADEDNSTIRRIQAWNKRIYAVVGYGLKGYGGDGGNAKGALLDHPTSFCFDQSGTMYIADSWNNVIRKVTGLTGIAAPKEEQTISIYPNPSTGIFELKLSDIHTNVEIIVTSMIGKRIIQRTSNEKKERIDLSAFPSGIYILTVATQTGRKEFKLCLNN